MATTTNRGEVTFNGRLITEKHKKTATSVPIDAVTSVTFTEYTWTMKHTWDRDAKFCIKITYGQPKPQWNGATLVPMPDEMEFRFPKSEGDSAKRLYRSLLMAINGRTPGSDG